MPPTHPEIFHNDRDVELIISNRSIIHNYANILIIQSGIIIFHIFFIVFFFICIIVGFIVISIDARVHVGIIDCHKGVVILTQDLFLSTPYFINIYCLRRIFILRVEIYRYITSFLVEYFARSLHVYS